MLFTSVCGTARSAVLGWQQVYRARRVISSIFIVAWHRLRSMHGGRDKYDARQNYEALYVFVYFVFRCFSFTFTESNL